MVGGLYVHPHVVGRTRSLTRPRHAAGNGGAYWAAEAASGGDPAGLPGSSGPCSARLPTWWARACRRSAQGNGTRNVGPAYLKCRFDIIEPFLPSKRTWDDPWSRLEPSPGLLELCSAAKTGAFATSASALSIAAGACKRKEVNVNQSSYPLQGWSDILPFPGPLASAPPPRSSACPRCWTRRPRHRSRGSTPTRPRKPTNCHCRNRRTMSEAGPTPWECHMNNPQLLLAPCEVSLGTPRHGGRR